MHSNVFISHPGLLSIICVIKRDKNDDKELTYPVALNEKKLGRSVRQSIT